MKAHDVPDWYIWSCEKIQYMFPKAHAAAYVMMAWRIAYCKVNYPLAYYCAYFSIRASAFSYEIMCQGQQHLEATMADYRKRSDTLTNNDGLGEKAADAIMEAAKDGPFLSKDDFRSRTKVSKTVIDMMSDLGLLGDIPESNQISLFDLVG